MPISSKTEITADVSHYYTPWFYKAVPREAWDAFVSSPKLFLVEPKGQEYKKRGFPGGAVVENLPANAGDTGSSPGLGRSHMPRSS